MRVFRLQSGERVRVGVVGALPFQLSLPRGSRIETPRNQSSGQALGLLWLRTMRHRGQTEWRPSV